MTGQGEATPVFLSVDCGTWGEADPLPPPLAWTSGSSLTLSAPCFSMLGPGSRQAGFSSPGDFKRNTRGHAGPASHDPPSLGSHLGEVTAMSCCRQSWTWTGGELPPPLLASVPMTLATWPEEGLELPIVWPVISCLCVTLHHHSRIDGSSLSLTGTISTGPNLVSLLGHSLLIPPTHSTRGTLGNF